MNTVWICGDSILRGVVWSPERERYTTTDRIGFADMAEQFALHVENRSRFGYTLEKGTSHLFRTLERGEACDIALLEYGGNDSDFNWAEVAASPTTEHFPQTPLDKYEEIYRKTVKNLRKKGIEPVLCSLVPVCSHRYLNWVSRKGLSKDNILAWLGDENAIYRYQERYSRKVEELAREQNCALIDLRGAFLSVRSMEKLFCEDGIHPNEDGQSLIRNTILHTPARVFSTLSAESA